MPTGECNFVTDFQTNKQMRRAIIFLIAIITVFSSKAQVLVGAERPDLYLPLLEGKRVALLSNHTGLINNAQEHTLDFMLRNQINVTTIFSPEHGFRGNADAGAHVSNSTDEKTGIPIASLYNGKDSSTPSPEVMARFDVIVCDLQDVGVRFYTYYITMLRLMNAAQAFDKEFVVFDRPNPIGMMVDGPILDPKLKSGVGALPIPVAHGMTLGELARMICGEGWLSGKNELKLTVIPCENYTHATRYVLPINPSPNLKSMHAIYLYPSTCYCEGTVASLGRGTDTPFEIYGHPQMKARGYSFTPRSMSGAKNPPHKNSKCNGVSLCNLPDDEIIANGVNLTYVIDAYRNTTLPKEKEFFTNFFDKLIGDSRIRTLIEQGKSAEEIKTLWADDVKQFREKRKPYLLYPEK